MVKAYHDAGMKVFIDVVYNHTGEGGAWNPADKTTYNGTAKLRRSSQNPGARPIIMPRWSRCAIAPPLLIGRSEASTGRRDGAGG